MTIDPGRNVSEFAVAAGRGLTQKANPLRVVQYNPMAWRIVDSGTQFLADVYVDPQGHVRVECDCRRCTAERFKALRDEADGRDTHGS